MATITLFAGTPFAYTYTLPWEWLDAEGSAIVEAMLDADAIEASVEYEVPALLAGLGTSCSDWFVLS